DDLLELFLAAGVVAEEAVVLAPGGHGARGQARHEAALDDLLRVVLEEDPAVLVDEVTEEPELLRAHARTALRVHQDRARRPSSAQAPASALTASLPPTEPSERAAEARTVGSSSERAKARASRLSGELGRWARASAAAARSAGSSALSALCSTGRSPS